MAVRPHSPSSLLSAQTKGAFEMDLTTPLAFLAGGFGVLMGASPLLQALRAHRRKSSADVSLPFLGVLLAGGLAWLLYGLAIGNLALIIGNSVGVAASTTAIVLTLRWRGGSPDPARAAFRT
jgi:uncharacterized protein with PQ loop repeat